jgi:hypothetical protein
MHSTLLSTSDLEFSFCISLLLTGLEGGSQISVCIAGLQVEILTRDLENMEQEFFPLHHDFCF